MKRILKLSLALGWALVPLLGGCATIHKSADGGDLDKVGQLLQKGVAVDARDEFGRTPLMWAIEDLDSVRYLAEQGADVNARDANGETARYNNAVSLWNNGFLTYRDYCCRRETPEGRAKALRLC